MILNLEEKEKLLNKARKLYDDIKDRKLKQSIRIDISPKYYDSNSRYVSYGFNYSTHGCITIFAKEIKEGIEELENYINFKKGIGEEYINGKSVTFLSQYDINALLDFIYNGDYIKRELNKIDENTRKELRDLLD